MPFIAHFTELRARLIRIILALVIGILVCFSFAEKLYAWLTQPIQPILQDPSAELIFISPVEPFFVYLKLSFIAAIFLTSPWTFYQIWRFIAPGLYQHEKRAILPMVAASSAIFVLGALFCYYVVLPLGLETLIATGMGTDFAAVAQISMDAYFDLVTKLMLAFGLIFEMPIFSLFLTRLGVINHKSLLKHWRIAIVINFIVAAILTPPDVVTQILLGVPMCLLYAVSIFLSWCVQKKAGGTSSP